MTILSRRRGGLVSFIVLLKFPENLFNYIVISRFLSVNKTQWHFKVVPMRNLINKKKL